MKRTSCKVLLKGLFAGFFVVFMALSAQAAEKELVSQVWGGFATAASKACFFDPFSEKTGTKVVLVPGGGDTMGKLASQVKSRNIEWDMISSWPLPTIENCAKQGLLEEIDYSIVTRAKELVPGAAIKYGLGYNFNSFILAYNNKKFKGDNYPKSWSDFFDIKKFPGPRAMSNWGSPEYNFLAALMADGVSPDKLIPIDYDRAFRKLDQIKPHIKVWYTSGDQLIQNLLEEEVVMAHATDGRTWMAISLGAPVNIVWDQGMLFLNYWAVVKGAPHKKTAMEFLNFYCSPEYQALYVNYTGYSTDNQKLLKFLAPNVQKTLAIYPDNLKKQINIDTTKISGYISAHQAEINERWNAWIAK